MKSATILKVFAVIFVLAVAVAIAQSPTPKYNFQTETKLTGSIEEIREVPKSCLGETGLYLILNTDAGPLQVQVAPADFLKMMEISFAKGDKIEVIGSKVMQDGNALVLAREITRNKDQFVMRDPKGEPVWTWLKKG